MPRTSAESWSERAQRVLVASKHHSGARRAVLELLDLQHCALSILLHGACEDCTE